MIVLLVLAAATPPSEEFVRDCFDRAKSETEIAFCEAGKRNWPEADPTEAACIANAATQSARDFCAAPAKQRAEGELSAQYAQLVEVLGGDRSSSSRLRASQAAWSTYRDRWCSAIANDPTERSQRQFDLDSFVSHLTRSRTRELGDWLLGDQP